MQLLHSNPYPVAEFASLSLLVDPSTTSSAVADVNHDDLASAAPSADSATNKEKQKSSSDNAAVTAAAATTAGGAGPDDAAGPPRPTPTAAPYCLSSATLGETMTVVSPLATSSAPAAHYALRELHGYLRSVHHEERRAEEEAASRRQRKKHKKRRKKKKRQQQQDQPRGRPGSNTAATRSNNRPIAPTGPDRGDSLQTLETMDTDDEYETDSDEDNSDDDQGTGRDLSREEKARKEEKSAEVLLAMLVAASEESKRKEAESTAADAAGAKEDGDDGNHHGEADGGAVPENWFEHHLRLRNAVRSDLLLDDAQLHDCYPNDVKVYRPQRSGGGMTLHYIVVRDSVLVGRMTGLLLGSAALTSGAAAAGGGASGKRAAAASALRSPANKASSSPGPSTSSRPGDNKSVSFNSASPPTSTATGPTGPTISAAVLTVGISGNNSTLGTSEVIPTLPLRFVDAVSLLQGLGIVSAKSVKASKSSTKPSSSSSLANILLEARRYARSTLSALLLADPDGLATNAVIDAERGVLDDDDHLFFADGSSVKGGRRGSSKYVTPRVSAGGGSKKFGFSSGKLKRRSGLSSSSKHGVNSSTGGGSRNSLGSNGVGAGAVAGPAERTRMLFDQYQILGLAEDDMPIPPYRARARLEACGKLQRRKRYGRGINPLDLGPIDVDAFAPPTRSDGRRAGLRGNGGSSPRRGAATTPTARGSSSLPPPSPSDQGGPRQGPNKDGSAPRLSGPRRDTGPTGGLRRVPRTSSRPSSVSRSRQSGNEAVAAKPPPMDPFGSDDQPDGQMNIRARMQPPAATFDPFAFNDSAGDGWDIQPGQVQLTTSAPDPDGGRGQSRGIVEALPVQITTPQGVNSDGFFDDAPMSPYAQPPSPSINRQTSHEAAASALEAAVAATAISAVSAPPLDSAADAPTRFQVSVALNEDLTCSYRDSKISSCSVEGMVQVQVKLPDGRGSLDDEEAPPFALYLKDSSRHLRSLQENKKYAGGYGAAVSALTGENIEDESDHNDRRFVVTLPRVGSYFPVMRYKCSPELRPVPIRVQTRVRPHGIYCRVALQISSNPANEDDLTDLTIIMAVPPTVRGETLITSPPGGVWDPEKRSVLWCVAELGEGEKFQLQAQFEMDQEAEASDGKPSFPVLVRSQCMYAQLSDVELEVGDVPELWPADVSMKLARRFRLSHRERS